MSGLSITSRLRSVSLGARLALLTGLIIMIGFLILAWGLSASSARMLKDRQQQAAGAQLDRVSEMIALFDHTLEQQATRFLQLFSDEQLVPPFTLDTTRQIEVVDQATPLLSDTRGQLNLDTARLDEFSQTTGAPVTIFARRGSDFIRVATSLKNQQGQRAMGTHLDPGSRSYQQLMAGKPYTGFSSLFGTPYITRYEPIRDASGAIIGATFIGIDIRQELDDLKARIRQLKVGDQGYFMIVDAAPAQQGQVIAGSPWEGQGLMQQRDHGGKPAWSGLFEAPAGVLHHAAGDDGQGAQTTWFRAYPDWQWVIAATAVDSEIEQALAHARQRFLLMALGLALLTAFGLYMLMRRQLGRPLGQAVSLARQLADGDLSKRLPVHRRDEIGRLIEAMNGIGDGLEKIVGRVRQAAEDIHHGSASLGAGNQELSRRTESQAASLEQTAASIEQLSAAVRQNTEHARLGRERMTEVTAVAQDTRAYMGRTEQTMSELNGTAVRVREIVGVIDEIAFQTNLLALNASVEAARAGEHGRGFAVVAEEVRRLAGRCSGAASDVQGLIGEAVTGITTSHDEVRDVGRRMEDLLARVEQVTTLVRDISQASEEQLAGIEQINTAVSELDNVTQHNAAMVETSSQNTQRLDQQSRALIETVAVFSQHGDTAATANAA